VMYLIDGDDLGTGGYFNQRTPTRANPQAYEEQAREHLRTLTERLTVAR